MPEYTLGFFLLAALAAMFAGISKGGFGSGAAFASASILSLVLDPTVALSLMLPVLLVIDVASLRPYWRKWAPHEMRVLIAAGLPGILLGMALFRIADANDLRLLIGIISVAFVAWHFAQSKGWLRQSKSEFPGWVGALAGIGTGFTSFVSHAGGPIAAVYLLSRDTAKTEYQATTVIVFWALNVAKVAAYAVLGLFSAELLLLDLALVPFALMGTWIGIRAHHLISEIAFFRLTYILLLVTGGRLIWVALT